MASKQSIVASFIEDAPPGELNDVVNDIKALTSDEPTLLSSQSNAFQNYNEGQFTTVKLPGSSQEVIVSPYNSLGDGKYYDTASNTSFTFDHTTQKASNAQSYTHDSPHADLVTSLTKSFATHAAEHYAAATTGVYATSAGEIALVLVANKYSPSNFWSGRWRSSYLLSPSDGTLTGAIKVDVHYYEDGNVRLLTDKTLDGLKGGSAAETVRALAAAERRYQEDLNRAFGSLNEGVFKSLRRQLPVTRQKIEWEKIGGYRLGQDIGGGRSH